MYLYIINIIVLLVLYVCSYSCVHFIVQEVKVKVVPAMTADSPLKPGRMLAWTVLLMILENLKPTEHFQNSLSTLLLQIASLYII